MKTIYEPPQARDLTVFSAEGQVVLGQCVSGPTPYYACEVGSGFVGACDTGATPDTSKCDAGSFHAQPACDPGLSAATICISGQKQQF